MLRHEGVAFLFVVVTRIGSYEGEWGSWVDSGNVGNFSGCAVFTSRCGQVGLCGM